MASEFLEQAAKLAHERHGLVYEPPQSPSCPLLPIYADCDEVWAGREQRAREELLWRVGEPGADITAMAAKLTAETGIIATEKWAAESISNALKRYRDLNDTGESNAWPIGSSALLQCNPCRHALRRTFAAVAMH